MEETTRTVTVTVAAPAQLSAAQAIYTSQQLPAAGPMVDGALYATQMLTGGAFFTGPVTPLR